MVAGIKGCKLGYHVSFLDIISSLTELLICRIKHIFLSKADVKLASFNKIKGSREVVKALMFCRVKNK